METGFGSFTDIAVPLSYFQDTLKRQAIVNAESILFSTIKTKAANLILTSISMKTDFPIILMKLSVKMQSQLLNFGMLREWAETEPIKKDYKVKMEVALAFSNKTKLKEFYHNSSWLENGGAPEKATRSAFVSQIDSYLKQSGKYLKSDGKISFQDVEDCLVLVISSSSTQTSYENQTKKAITNKFIQEALTDFLKHQLEVYFIENKLEADKIAIKF